MIKTNQLREGVKEGKKDRESSWERKRERERDEEGMKTRGTLMYYAYIVHLF